MSGDREVSLHLLGNRISSELTNMLEYKSFFHHLQRAAGSEEVDEEDFPSSLRRHLSGSGLETQLRNMVFHWLKEKCTGLTPLALEPLNYFTKAQETWEGRVWKSVLSIGSEMGLPLSRQRLTSEQENIEENWNEFSQTGIDVSRYKPVYSPKDFLDSILQISDPNHQLNKSEKLWSSLAGIPIKVISLRELKCLFSDLTTGEPHYDLVRNLCSEESETGGSSTRNFQTQRTKLGAIVEENRLAPVAQEFLKKGCSPNLRPKLWQLILGSHVTKEHSAYYGELKRNVIKEELLIDRLILKDVQLTAANDDQYFVFEDSLYQLFLCFARDNSLLDLKKSKGSLAQVKIPKNLQISDLPKIYPPNGIVPFHGFTMYAAPLCYLFDNPESLYFTFRAFYKRYWFRLHEISSHENGIVCLCILFEKLLHRHETQLWFHLRTLRISPVRLVFRWLMKGFSGYLPAEEVLTLWDLILSYNSLHILPLFAMGVVSIRRENLLTAQNPPTVDCVLADLSSISVLPVLHLALSKENF